MGRQRKNYSAAFEAQVALAAIRGDCTANELAAKHGLHPTLISNWKTALLGGPNPSSPPAAEPPPPTTGPNPPNSSSRSAG